MGVRFVIPRFLKVACAYRDGQSGIMVHARLHLIALALLNRISDKRRLFGGKR
jgi:hypothetical protein